MDQSYTQPHVLLPFVERYLGAESPYPSVTCRMLATGAMAVTLGTEGGAPLEIHWTEHGDTPPVVRTPHGAFALPCDTPRAPTEPETAALRHVARRMGGLVRGEPPFLLGWRNRNPQKVFWGTHMFSRLAPDLFVKGQTRYFDYVLSALDEYEGLVNLTFESRTRRVVARLTLRALLDEEPFMAWGPIAMVILEDDRDETERRDRAHAVDQFVGYCLSRTLPPVMDLVFERRDPPLGYIPDDHHVDFLIPEPPDDSSWFQMIFAANDDVAIATSCDRECLNLFSFMSTPSEGWTTLTPWHIPPSTTILDRIFHIRLGGMATILGNDLADQCLEVIGRQPRRPRFVLFVDSCISRLVGEDVAGAVERFDERGEIPIVLYDIKLVQEPYLVQVRTFWKKTFDALARPDREPEPRRAVFLGMGDALDDELRGALEARGVTIGGSIFPSLDIDAVEELYATSHVVMNEWRFVDVMFAGLLEALQRPVTTVPLPYGIAGTTAWLDTVTAAVVGEEHASPSSPVPDEVVERFAAATAPLAGHRVALFARLDNVVAQLAPRERFGIPLISFFHELGLGVALHLFAGPTDQGDLGEVARALGLSSEHGDTVERYQSWRELPRLVAEGDFRLVYTETYRDERITAMGKVPLTIPSFEAGYRGAVRTAERIAAMLRVPFYARYGRYLKGPFDHFQRGTGGM